MPHRPTPANGVRAGTIPGHAGISGYPPWHERHPHLFTATKWMVVAVLSGLLGGIGWLLIDLRDGVRDTGAAARQLPVLKDRVREVEGEVREQRVHLEHIREGIDRLERAAGTKPNPPIAPALGPPEPQP